MDRRDSVGVDAFQERKIIVTTGAGDIFGGSAVYQVFASGVAPEQLSTERLAEIVRFANAAASLSTTKHGGIPSIPSKEEVEAFLSRGV